jgi:hypothetical protein
MAALLVLARQTVSRLLLVTLHALAAPFQLGYGRLALRGRGCVVDRASPRMRVPMVAFCTSADFLGSSPARIQHSLLRPSKHQVSPAASLCTSLSSISLSYTSLPDLAALSARACRPSTFLNPTPLAVVSVQEYGTLLTLQKTCCSSNHLQTACAAQLICLVDVPLLHYCIDLLY